MTVYVSGPMTGYPEFNYPAFNAAADALRAAGYPVVNPAELGYVEHWSWSDYLRRDVGLMLTGMMPDGDIHPDVVTGGPVDALALLPGHEHSHGAAFEAYVARRLEWQIQTVDAWLWAARPAEPRAEAPSA